MMVVNTSDWSYEDVAAYGKEITAAFRKLQERYPEDVTVQSLFDDCMMGAKQLWLILDEDDGFVSMAMTRVATIPATGLKIVTMCDLAGDGGQECQQELGNTVEAWAKEIGAHYTAIEGRAGWHKVMKKRGYDEYARLWRKRVA